MEFIYSKENSMMDGLIKSWIPDEEIEESALQQAFNLSNLPFVFKHIALMPDCHMGYGMPIGGILATKDIIIPNAVGVDIGCGMIAVKTSLKEIDKETIKKIMGGSKGYKSGIRTKIPVGFNKHSKKQSHIHMPSTNPIYDSFKQRDIDSIVLQNHEKALKQIGTLGGGNHFIEIQKGSDNHIWIMIHSGSRNIGYQVAKHYNNLAKELNKKWYVGVPKNYDLAFLPINSTEGQDYLNEMDYCVEFALNNRKLMLKRIKESFLDIIPDIKFDNEINIAHNYAAMENHFNENVMVHRKGATKAYKDQLGIIPGSQGTSSYIVKGLGNPDSFKSCSHGAGRNMSRTKAKENLNLENEMKILNEQGIIHGMRNIKDLDEAPGAYKDIYKVMENQRDLVKIMVELKPLAVIKG